MFSLFLFGTFWFWALLFTAWCLITVFTENDSTFKASIVFIATACLLEWFGKIQLFQAIWHHPKEDVIYLLGYLAIGLLFSLYKWTSYVRHMVKDDRRQYGSESLIAPTVDSHSTRIIGWMMYWPFSLIWTLINDPIRWLFTFVYNESKAVFQKISDNIYAKANAEIAAKKAAAQTPRNTVGQI